MLRKPVTPPTLCPAEKPLKRFTIPRGSGVVPTSNKIQNSGLKYRQNPSKNHKCDDNLVPLVCLKHENNLNNDFSSFLLMVP